MDCSEPGIIELTDIVDQNIAGDFEEEIIELIDIVEGDIYEEATSPLEEESEEEVVEVADELFDTGKEINVNENGIEDFDLEFDNEEITEKIQDQNKIETIAEVKINLQKDLNDIIKS